MAKAFLDKDGLTTFAALMYNKVKSYVTGKMATSISDSSTDNDIPTSKAVFDHVKNNTVAAGPAFEVITDTASTTGVEGKFYLLESSVDGVSSYDLMAFHSETWINLSKKDELTAIPHSDINSIVFVE